MTKDMIFEHVREHAAIYAVGGVVLLVIVVVFRKVVVPVLYHATEYIIYCAAAHTLIAGCARAFSWFREETQFKNYKGETVEEFKPYTTPWNLNFWKMEEYNPHWLFWFEIAVAAFLLYIVIVIRPTRLKRKPMVSKKPKPGQLSGSVSYQDRLNQAGRPGKKYKAAR